MIADQTIHLPSINQISKLMKGIDFNLDEVTDGRNENIYMEVELSLKLAISISCLLFCATCKSMASQPYISGSAYLR